MAHHVCRVCGTGFHTDLFGRRERDWIKNDMYCDMNFDQIAEFADIAKEITV